MTKLLLIIGVTFFVVYLLKRAGRSRDTAAPKSGKPVEDMVRCQVCGVNLPRSEALLSNGRIYCCEAHRRQGE